MYIPGTRHNTNAVVGGEGGGLRAAIVPTGTPVHRGKTRQNLERAFDFVSSYLVLL